MDFGWRFAFGNETDPAKDFDPTPASEMFNYLTKSGNARARRNRILTTAAGTNWICPRLGGGGTVRRARSGSHGYKPSAKTFPERSVGWYRKSFSIPASDLGRRISVDFDGVFRDSQVWVNGFYLGREASGYSSFSYDISDYLNYGGNQRHRRCAWTRPSKKAGFMRARAFTGTSG